MISDEYITLSVLQAPRAGLVPWTYHEQHERVMQAVTRLPIGGKCLMVLK